MLLTGVNRPKNQVLNLYTREAGYSESDLIHFAYGHLESAGCLFRCGHVGYDSAAYLGHLGIELLLKALLLYRTNKFPNCHDLNKLRNLLEAADCEITFSSEGVAVLEKVNRFYSLRYPAGGPSEPFLAEDLVALEALARQLVNTLPLELQQEYAPQVRKGGRDLLRKSID
ncbi:MAG: HEPN domain-containing protein [Myxococcales bacterium]|nr:HEPN domain-containing protein [Myxococcales bacterium]